jgi:predicted metal-dependent hydrolase
MYPDDYIKFLAHFHGDRDYFECHEILEEYWKSVDKNNKTSHWVGLILMAVSFYHHRRENVKGAERTLRKGINILENHPAETAKLGLEPGQLTKDLKNRLQIIKAGGKYKSYNLPIKDPILQARCKKMCSGLGFTWCADSNFKDDDLVHRHKKRDRSMVIKERLEALQRKNK